MVSPGSESACAPSEATRPAEDLAPTGDWALFLDVDGTILKFASTPEGVAPPDGLRGLLESVAGALGGALALVSGRTIADLDHLFAPLRLPLAGLHGLERRDAQGQVHILAEAESLDHLRAPLAELAGSREGLLLEDKGRALAVHYRRTPGQAAAVRQEVDRLVEPSNRDLRVIHGNMVSEIKPRRADKGTAIRAFMAEAPFAGRRPVFLGDDVTDEDGFAAVDQLGGLAIRVGEDERETRASYSLADVDAVVAWLAQVEATLHGKGGASAS